jgi:cytidylate kinase
MKKINIAIDGPAGAGKSTVAREVAQKLQYIYIDTGAIYRAVTWQALQKKVHISEQALVQLAKEIRISFAPASKGQTVYVNEQNVTETIRSREVTNRVSKVASYAGVREILVSMQQKLAEEKGVVMDGRDIGTHVLPDAEVKVFLSASLEERAKRRFIELQDKDESASFEEIMNEMNQRDEQDINRSVAPLKKAGDAIEIDTTGLSVEDVIQKIINLVKACK